MFVSRSSLLPLLVALLLLAVLHHPAIAASTEDGVFITNRRSIPVRLHRPDVPLSAIRQVDFWQTSDQGRTWLLVREVVVDETISEQAAIRYDFRPRNDGRYGFRICLHFHDGRSDAEPRSGQAPAPADMIEIDRTPPEILRFTLSQEDADQWLIEWTVRDMHLKPRPVSLFWSSDGASWQSLGEAQAGHGNQLRSLPEAASHLRLQALDRAGNSSEQDRQLRRRVPPVTEEPDPPQEEIAEEAEIPEQQATALIPEDPIPHREEPPSEQAEEPLSQPSSRPLLPSIEELRAAQASAEAAQRASSRAEDPALSQEVLMPRPEIPAGHQDIVEPFLERSSPTRSWDPAPAAALERMSPEPQSEPKTQGSPARSLPSSARPAPPEQTLAAAREQLRAQDLVSAQVLYRSLRGTSVAAQALPEEMALLRRLNRHDEALAIHRAAPSTVLTEASHILRAWILLDLGESQAALDQLAALGSDGTRLRERRLIRALALHQAGQRRAAQEEMQQLAAGTDVWAQSAQRWLNQQSR